LCRAHLANLTPLFEIDQLGVRDRGSGRPGCGSLRDLEVDGSRLRRTPIPESRFPNPAAGRSPIHPALKDSGVPGMMERTMGANGAEDLPATVASPGGEGDGSGRAGEREARRKAIAWPEPWPAAHESRAWIAGRELGCESPFTVRPDKSRVAPTYWRSVPNEFCWIAGCSIRNESIPRVLTARWRSIPANWTR
jgi:hypothetical protein